MNKYVFFLILPLASVKLITIPWGKNNKFSFHFTKFTICIFYVDFVLFLVVSFFFFSCYPSFFLLLYFCSVSSFLLFLCPILLLLLRFYWFIYHFVLLSTWHLSKNFIIQFPYPFLSSQLISALHAFCSLLGN